MLTLLNSVGIVQLQIIFKCVCLKMRVLNLPLAYVKINGAVLSLLKSTNGL